MSAGFVNETPIDDFFEFVIAIGQGNESEEEKIEMIKDAFLPWFSVTFKIAPFSSVLKHEKHGGVIGVTSYRFICPYEKVEKEWGPQFVSFTLRGDIWQEFATLFRALNPDSTLKEVLKFGSGVDMIRFGKKYRER